MKIVHYIADRMHRPIDLNILWHIDTLLGNDCETNETTAIARQQLRKYATGLEPLLGSSPRATMEVLLEAVFSTWSSPRLCHSIDRVQFS
jgi:hypothetical protein